MGQCRGPVRELARSGLLCVSLLLALGQPSLDGSLSIAGRRGRDMADAAGLAVSHFRGLRVHLTQLASGAAVDLHALRIQLEKSRPAFRQLLVERPQNADERREIEAREYRS